MSNNQSGEAAKAVVRRNTEEVQSKGNFDVCVTYVKEQMGHHSIQVTVDLYGHLIPGANRAAANRLEAHILPTSQAVAVAHA